MRAIVVGAGALAGRTRRALGALVADGFVRDCVTVASDRDLADALEGARSAWIVRAGAWLLAPFRDEPPPSATGRDLVALGARFRDEGGAPVLDPSWQRSPSSVYVESATRFAEALRALSEPSLAGAVAALEAQRARVVRVHRLDVVHDPRLRVLTLVPSLHRGGAERIALSLHAGLGARGVASTLGVLDRPSRSSFPTPANTVEFDPDESPRRGPREVRLEDATALAKLGGFDVVHSHLLTGDELQAVRTSGLPIAATLHNTREGWPAGLDRPRSGDATIDLAFACSRKVAEDATHASIAPWSTIVWNGIEDAPLPTRHEARSLFGIADDTLVLLSVANMRPQKRLDRLPDVVAALRQRGTPAVLLHVGEVLSSRPENVAAENAFRARIAEADVAPFVVLAGSRNDQVAYAAADVLVTTSAHEGLSLVQLEALAAGLPVVTTEVGGTCELAEKHPGAVHLVPSDEDAIVDAIGRAIGTRAPGLAPDFRPRAMVERTHLYLASLAERAAAIEAPGGLVLVTNNFVTGGAQSSARRLLVELARRGIGVAAITLEEQPEFPSAGRRALEAAGIHVHPAPSARFHAVDETVLSAVAAIRARAPRAVVFWNAIPEHKVLLAEALSDLRLFDVSPGEMYFTSLARYFERPRAGSPITTPASYGALLAGVAVKYEAERAHAEGVLGKTAVVIPNGVSIPTTAPVRRERGAGPIVLGTLARLSPDKRLDVLIDAFRTVVAKLGDRVVLRIAGGPEPRFPEHAADLQARAEGLPVSWVGDLDDPSAFLDSLDVFVAVSEPSGCPNANLEAMAVGLPIAATRGGGAEEQLEHRTTAILARKCDPNELAISILELAEDPVLARNLGLNAHREARRRFSVDRMADDYERFFRDGGPCVFCRDATSLDLAAKLP